MPLGIAAVSQLAQTATQVKLCDYNSSTDCVTSIAGTFPILNLRDQISLVSRKHCRR